MILESFSTMPTRSALNILGTVLATTGLLSACAISPSVVDRRDVIGKAGTEQAPLVTPYKSASTMREALACMDRMLASEQVPSTLIAIKTIPDSSGLFQTGTKEMIITALSRMSRASQAFRVVDYEVDALKQDTVQTLTSLLLNNGQLELRKPQIYVSGAITFGDKTVVSKRSSFGVSTKNTDAGYSWDVSGTMVGLDLHLGDMNSRTLFPGMDSANELVVASGGKAIELGGRASGLPRHIYELGAQFERAAETNQGAGAAIRLLVDLATIELVGKWAKLPYWDCVEYEQNHPEFKRQMRTWYDDISVSDRISLAQRVLELQGFWQGGLDGKDSAGLRSAVAAYQSALDLTPVGVVNFETYASLMGGYVGMSAEGTLSPTQSRQVDHMQATLVGLPFNEPKAQHIGIAMVGRREPVLTVGDSVVLRVAPARTGYLYCYYKDAAQTVSQVYPNPLQTATVVQGQHGVLIPDVSQANSFLIQTAAAGNEEVYCAMTQRPLTGKVSGTLTNAKLEPVPGVSDMATVRKALEASGQVVSSGAYEWSVKPAKARARRGS